MWLIDDALVICLTTPEKRLQWINNPSIIGCGKWENNWLLPRVDSHFSPSIVCDIFTYSLLGFLFFSLELTRGYCAAIGRQRLELSDGHLAPFVGHLSCCPFPNDPSHFPIDCVLHVQWTACMQMRYEPSARMTRFDLAGNRVAKSVMLISPQRPTWLPGNQDASWLHLALYDWPCPSVDWLLPTVTVLAMKRLINTNLLNLTGLKESQRIPPNPLPTFNRFPLVSVQFQCNFSAVSVQFQCSFSAVILKALAPPWATRPASRSSVRNEANNLDAILGMIYCGSHDIVRWFSDQVLV